MKEIKDAKIGDTFYSNKIEKTKIDPFPGFENSKSMVYAGVYPIDPTDYDDLKRSIGKLQLSDASIKMDYEHSLALGSGFRLGFLGLLHLDVFRQRLEDEYDQDILVTNPSVPYRCTLKNNTKVIVENAICAPKREDIKSWEEIYVMATIITPKQFYSGINRLCLEKRADEIDYHEINEDHIRIIYEIPLAEIVTDFFDKLKSLSEGYASLDYEISGYKEADIKILGFLLNGELIDALSFLVNSENAERKAKAFCKKLKENIPQCLFEVAIQAQLDKKIICREDLKPYRKDVTAKCYGGDMSRRRKLLDKQKKGKKKMRTLGNVNVSSETFLALLKNDGKD